MVLRMMILPGKADWKLGFFGMCRMCCLQYPAGFLCGIHL